MDTQTTATLEAIYDKCAANEDNIITVLQEIQKEFGYIQEEVVHWFSERSNIPASKYYGVVTFYSQFHQHPRGKNIVTVCCGTVCHVKGAPRIIAKVREDLKLGEDQVTTKDMQFTLERVNCVGACSIAPVVLVNEKVLGKVTPSKMVKSLKEHKG
ncbi:NAD(P)H-dependent oxidoreductase subunit E [Desulforhopalus sp. IMCC35007]|jgi:NADH:ubiquinone oxidoreductase subunit E|uniref:NADH-quinone oxidoreductase subunit NuoE family protein n=1 Tax=Desulforhopalus sp. IMCC35007 TaxID=2569543 RepID=UPI0010ADD42C|nr:NAD(P)H-dependent oxidoreductase subunit E [Desulforhopalus sp. IMCC35007]TKB07971.1 NAD(P)H-dependent oxidoreductase subunit E [Desulforhopalus sp. IMCC35007]